MALSSREVDEYAFIDFEKKWIHGKVRQIVEVEVEGTGRNESSE